MWPEREPSRVEQSGYSWYFCKCTSCPDFLLCTLAVMCVACIQPTHISQNIPWFSGLATVLGLRVERACGLFGLFHLLLSTSTSSPVYKCSCSTSNPSLWNVALLSKVFLWVFFFFKKHKSPGWLFWTKPSSLLGQMTSSMAKDWL